VAAASNFSQLAPTSISTGGNVNSETTAMVVAEFQRNVGAMLAAAGINPLYTDSTQFYSTSYETSG